MQNLEHPDTYVRMLFVDFSSAFSPVKLHQAWTDCTSVLLDQSLSPTGLKWGELVTAHRPHRSATQEHRRDMCSAPPYSPMVAPPLTPQTWWWKFADDREEIHHLIGWCSEDTLVLNTSRTKELIVDFSRSRRIAEHSPLYHSWGGCTAGGQHQIPYHPCHIWPHLARTHTHTHPSEGQ